MDFQQLTELVAQAEFHKFLKLVPVSSDEESGTVVFELPYDDAYSIFPAAGNYHGGVIASLVDVAGAMACSLVKGHPTPTVNLRIDFMQTPRRTDLVATGKVCRIGRSIGVADVEIAGKDGTTYALGRGTFSTVSPEPKLFEKA
ncbi:PaaI family thioesterase [Nitratireductor pacificus]|nr:PaaI family thioesterase [Nitratireductor pacificus]